MDGVFMSLKDQVQYRVIEEFRSREFNRSEAARKLDLTERTITRKTNAVRRRGFAGIKHGNSKRSPRNKILAAVRDFYLNLYRTKYSKFNFKHALQFIFERESPPASVCYTTFRLWCRSEGLGKVKARRRSKAHISRERSANEGHQLQLDGSPEAWNGVDVWCLLATIDDATSDIPGAKFEPTETTWGCMDLMRSVVERKGRPEFVVTDRAGWSARPGCKRQHFSQFVRACRELDITVIATSSPESKGRIERTNRTFQDRLIAELDFHGIKSMADSNRYLEQVFLPDWRTRFGVEPSSDATRYRPVDASIKLEDVFCLKETRVVNRGHSISYKAETYVLNPGRHGSLWRKEIVVHEYRNGEFKIFYAGEAISYSQMAKPGRRWRMGA